MLDIILFLVSLASCFEKPEWPTPTENWGAPSTEYPDIQENYGTSSIVGITIASFFAGLTLISVAIMWIKGTPHKKKDDSIVSKSISNSLEI